MSPRDRRGPPHRRTAFAPRGPAERRPEALWIYGIHAVLAALANPNREVKRLLATRNALARLTEAGAKLPEAVEDAAPRDLDRLLGPDAVHQGVAAEVGPLVELGLDALGDRRLVLVLDQVTDPHNVGAILRSAAAFDAAVVTTLRHSPAESSVLAKAASGALDTVPLIRIGNLARALDELGAMGFKRIGLDSDAPAALPEGLSGDRIALVLGAEGKGLRRLTRDTCDALARLPVPGAIHSLNVSNAAVLALYVAAEHVARSG